MKTNRSASHPAPFQVIDCTPITTTHFFGKFRHPDWAERLFVWLEEIETDQIMRETTEAVLKALLETKRDLRQRELSQKLKPVGQEV